MTLCDQVLAPYAPPRPCPVLTCRMMLPGLHSRSPSARRRLGTALRAPYAMPGTHIASGGSG
eukprot:2180578-Rhodomonas_salina.5